MDLARVTHFQLEEELIASIVDASPVGMTLINKDKEILFANQKMTAIFGWTREELIGNFIDVFIPSCFRNHHTDLIKRFFEMPMARSMGNNDNIIGLTKDGQNIPIEVGLSPIDIRGCRYVLASILDISDRKRAEELERSNQLLRFAAGHDFLTGLPNRNLFMEISQNLRHLSIRNGSRLTVMFIDLDGFKIINDQYGHDVGDQVLRKIASTLSKEVRKSDVVSRIGGDEFLLCLTELHDVDEVQKKSVTLLSAISAIKITDFPSIQISASIGAAHAELSESISLVEFIKQSDRLMYGAKKAGGGKALVDEFAISATSKKSRV